MSFLGRSPEKNGFTLIEVMLVVALIGVIVTLVQINFVGSNAEEKLKRESLRFAGVFELAAEYALLNNLELGIVLEEEQYQIVGFDGVRWSNLPDNTLFAPHKFADDIIFDLQLDDLPLEQPPLFDSETFVVEQDDFTEEEEKIIVPQLYILSGGDITPFSIEFSLGNEFDQADISYKVTGLYSTPLTVEGPIVND